MTKPTGTPRPALFFDRDGVLIEDVGYPHRPEDLRWTPGAREAVLGLTRAGWWTFVVTNQSGVARGYYELDALDGFHARMQAELGRIGARIDAFYACPHHPEAALARWRHPDHPDRKPNPGMLLRAMAEHAVDRDRSVLIGDRPSDLEAARRAGVASMAYSGGDLRAVIATILSRAASDQARHAAAFCSK